MSVPSSKWTSFPRFTLVFLGLAICVFAWGLKYKLSLYDPPQSISHKIPTAKLLSKNEQRALADNPVTSSAKPTVKAIHALLSSVFLCFLLPFRLFRALVQGREERDSGEPWRLRTRASLNAFFFRPPPARA